MKGLKVHFSALTFSTKNGRKNGKMVISKIPKTLTVTVLVFDFHV